MFSFSKAFFLALLTGPSTAYAKPSMSSSFLRDVVMGGGTLRSRNQQQQQQKQPHRILDPSLLEKAGKMLNNELIDPSSNLHRDLLAKALPIHEFEAKYGVSLGRSSSSSGRKLGDDNGDDDNAFAIDANNAISFSGYSLRFAKCQPVQYFSERALQLGEHSPMITNDIVVLRLCPANSCSDASEYGCHYNFSEYAMELSEYVRIMLYYSALKRDYMCDYCNDCLGNNNNNRRAEDNEGDEGEEGGEDDNKDNEQEGEQEEQQQDDGEQQQDQQQDENNEEEAEEEYYDYSLYACGSWNTYCTDYAELCVGQNNNNNNNNNQNGGGENNNYYMAYEDYLDYLYCSEVMYNDYAYFVKPRCDGYQGTIKMGIFYDKYCNQFAGNEVSLKDVGMGFKESAFQSFYSNSCLDCSESDYPPYDANSILCNVMHNSAAKCTEDMSYDLFGDDGSEDSSECSFIESIRFGTYNELGQLATRGANGQVAEQMTDGQKMALGIALALCVGLVVYACYLHHAMTNLLIKSLSHRELLPPSRHQSRTSRTSSPRRSSGRRSKKSNEPDWDETQSNGEYA